MRSKFEGWSLKIAAVSLFAALAGCASVTTLDRAGLKTPDGREIVAAVDVRNAKWQLLRFITIASGDPSCPNDLSFCLFRNTVTTQNQLSMLEMECRRLGATEAVDVATYVNDEVACWGLFKRHKMHTSATLVK